MPALTAAWKAALETFRLADRPCPNCGGSGCNTCGDTGVIHDL